MIIIRPTASLAKRMKERLQAVETQSTSVMGDWYANDIVLDRKQFILCVSSRSRLSVVMDAAPYATFPGRLTDTVTEVLRAIGIEESKIQTERRQMDEFKLAKTINKSILGSLNENKFQLEAFNHMGRLNLKSTLEMSLYLSETISLVIPEGYPRDATLNLFGQEIKKARSPIQTPELEKPRLYLVK